MDGALSGVIREWDRDSGPRRPQECIWYSLWDLLLSLVQRWGPPVSWIVHVGHLRGLPGPHVVIIHTKRHMCRVTRAVHDVRWR